MPVRVERPFQKDGLPGRVGPFVAVAVLSLGTLPFAESLDGRLVLAAVLGIVVLIIAIFLVPWDRLPRWSDAIVPLTYFVVIFVLREAQGGSGGTFGFLVFLPVIWFALYGTRREILLAIAGVCVFFAVGPLVIGPPAHPLDELGRAVVATMVTAVMGFVVLRLVQERQQVTDELERSNRDLEVFASSASHDLAQPVALITGYADLVERRYADSLDDEGVAFLRLIGDSARRLRHMISGLLELARVGGGEEPDKPADAGVAAQLAIDLYRDQIDRLNAAVRVGPLPKVWIDEAQLTQVFGNLLSNSLKFTNGRQPRVDLSAIQKGDWCQFRLADNGVGIPPEKAEHMFEMFAREHPDEADGHGIGLALVRRIVEGRGGRIWVEPDSVGGADIRFLLPAA
jgi:signal transduction histidine kinase